MTITPEQLRNHLDEHLDRIATQVAEHELRKRLALRAFMPASFDDLVDECRQYVAVRLLRPTTLVKMAARCWEESNDESENVCRLAYGWARKCARHFLRDTVKRHEQKRVRASVERMQSILENTDIADDPMTQLLRKEEEDARADFILRVRLALTKLPANQRQAVEKVLLHGMTKTKVAKLLKCDRKTLKKWLTQGCAQLREMLNSD